MWAENLMTCWNITLGSVQILVIGMHHRNYVYSPPLVV